MKLVNRLSVFFLAALAVVLLLYSGILYAFVRSTLMHQFEHELHGALNSLVAAIEVEPEEVKWQPLEHTIALGSVPGSDGVQWVVIGDRSRVVEKSVNASTDMIAQSKAIASGAPHTVDEEPWPLNSDWHVLHQRLAAPSPEYSERELDEFDEIMVVVARSAAPLNANLHRLLLLVCVLPAAVWLVAAAGGRWFCRRALQPVLDMSEQARSMTGADFQSRLPVANAGDELTDFAIAFNTLLDRQHRAFEQQRRFTGNAAHELRTPLTVLLGQIDVALRRSRTPQEYSDTLQLLRGKTTQLQAIVESLLFLARAEEDSASPHAETFSVDAWLSDYMGRWNDNPRRDDIRLQVDSTGVRQIHASPVLLARLLDNLIENALKYSSPGTKVEVRTRNGDSEVLIAVEDHGRGIAPENLAEIFHPFFRSQDAREAGIAGTGLGLALARRIATVLGGRLDCTSELGRGSRFTLRLPTASSQLAASSVSLKPV